MKILTHTLLLLTLFTYHNNYVNEKTKQQLLQAELFKKEEKFKEAIYNLASVIAQEPHNITAYFNLGSILLNIGQIDKALESFEYILKWSPGTISAEYNIGYTYKTAGKLDKAIEIYKNVIAQKPDYDAAHLALGFAYIQKGDFKQGWKQHQRYLIKSGKNADKLRFLLEHNQIHNKTILLIFEGGMGDTFHFIRYAIRLNNLGAKIIAKVQKPLVTLLSCCPYINQVISKETPIPTYDASASLMSLPAIFNDNEITFPRTIPYLFPDQTLIKYWKEELAHNTQLKIGVCWQSDTHNDSSRLPIARRGIPLEKLHQLSSIKNIQLYSLQKNDGLKQCAHLPSNFPLHIFNDSFDTKNGSFMDTAAVMMNMDLILTVDTAIAHLAGALGRPVWLLLPYATDWRWIINRTDSPWYPTMRIFKQPKPFDWETVIQKVCNALKKIERS